MNKILLTLKTGFRIKIVLIIFILSSASINTNNLPTYEFGSFKNKSYFNSIFYQNEISEINEADALYAKGKSNMLKAEKYFRKADGYNKIDQNQGGKSHKKALKFEKKATKIAVKAYENYFNAINKKFHIYSNSLGRINNNNSKKHLKAEELSIDARTFYMNGIEIMQSAKKLKGKEKTDVYEKAFDEQINALEFQEYAFMIFKNDPAIKYDSKSDKIIFNNKDVSDEENIVTDLTDNNDNTIIENNDYDPGKDPNLYISKEDEIVKKLNISETDKMQLEDANDKRGFADILMKEVDKDYMKIDNIRYEAAGIDDEYEKDLKIKMASGLEKVLFNKMIKAAKLYYEADKMKYDVYLKYLPSARSSKKFAQGKKHEDKAVSLHSSASKIFHKANFNSNHKSNHYIQLMNAVQTELSAIQEQENAFSTYFEFNITPLEDPNELVEVTNNVTGKTNDRGQNKSRKLTYNYMGSYIYSKLNPEPVPLIHKSGIIFKVQLGLFKGLLSLSQYGKYSPISYDSYRNNPYRRFFLGEYRSYKAAEYALNQVVTKGLTDPFIVTYIDGERKTATYGISKIVRNEEFERIEAKEMAYLTGNVNETSTNNESNKTRIDETKINDISSVTGVAYCVQLGNFSTIKKIDDFKGIKPIFVEKTGAIYRYMEGTFSTYFDAKTAAKKASNVGFKEAFVIAYNNGSKITLSEAEKLVKQTNSETNYYQTKADEIYFSVQIGLYSHKLSSEELKQFSNITTNYKLSVNQAAGGLYLYTTGKYEDYKQAANAKKDIKNKGIEGFVIAFKNGKKISASKAVELLKEN